MDTTEVAVPISLGFLVLLILACAVALQNAGPFVSFADQAVSNAATAMEFSAAKAETLYLEAMVGAETSPLVFSSPLLEGGDQQQEVVDHRGLVKITSVGNSRGCEYHVEFPRLKLPSLDHTFYRAPQEQGGRMGVSDCGYDGNISLGREIVKHLRKHMSWLGKSYHVQKYVFALIVNALEELLGDNAVFWRVEIFELLKNFK